MQSQDPHELAPALRFLLPNPPAVFVGRLAEAEQLAQLASRGPLAVVVGPGGIGKSALVRHVIHRQLDEHSALLVRGRKQDNLDQLGLDILRALTDSERVEAGFESSAELAAAVLDLAERQRRLVVVEDLHHLPAEEAERWLELLASYARRSRWVITTRARPALAGVQELVIELGPLSDAAARALARHCRHEASEEEIEALVKAGAGSPLWIRQLAATARDPSAARALFAGLPQEVVRYLAMLSVVEEPLRDGQLAASEETRRAIEQRGMIVSERETHRLHDALVDHVIEQLTEDERGRARRDAADALGSAPLASAQLEAFRLRLLSRDLDAAAALLEAHRAWVDAGLGPRLFRLLVDERDPRFDSLKLAVAVEVGSQASLGWLIAQPAPAAEADRLLWIQGLLRSGRAKRAMEELEALGGETHADPEVQLLYARALCDAGYPRRSAELLQKITPRSAVERARRDLHLAKALFHADDSRGSAKKLERLARELDALPEAVARELAGERRGLLIQLGLRNELTEEGAEDPLGASRGRGIQGLIFYGLRLGAAGRFGGSTRLLRQLTQSADLPAGSSVLASLAAVLLRVPKGDVRGLDALTRNMVHEAEQLGNATLYHWAYLVERMVNLARAHERPELPWAPTVPPPTGIPARYLQILRALHAARRGEAVAEEDMPRPRDGDGPLVESTSQVAEALVRLLGGDADRAVFLAAQASRRITREGYAFFEGEAVLVRVYAELTLGRTVELARGVEELSNLATALSSRRYRALARLIGAALDDEPDVPLLLGALHEHDAAPIVARAAAWLLGGPQSPDALDRLLVEGIAARWRSRVRSLVGGVTPEWVIDPAARRVHLPGRSVEASPLATRILEGLFAAGGAASLAEVARLGWDLDEYHQLRDSKRVHVAIRRLRQLVEDDPGQPRRILTTADGYRLSPEAPPGLVGP